MKVFRYRIAGLVAALALAAPATAQPLFFVENGGVPLFYVNADGSLTLHTGAAHGYVLTSDATGNATWMPPSSGSLTLPFTGSTNTTGAAFEVENTNATLGASALKATSGADGLVVASAGTPSATVTNGANNGVEVRGAQGHGVFVGQADGAGVVVQAAATNGVTIGTAGADGLFVSNAAGDGVHVASAGDQAGYFNGDVEVTGTLTLPSGATSGHVLTSDASGNASWQTLPGGGGLTLPFAGTTNTAGAAFSVENTNAVGDGLVVPSAGRDGVVVGTVGNPTTTFSSPLSNGLEVNGAEGNGLYVGRADQNGVQVQSTGFDGLQVIMAGDDGLHVSTTVGNGIYVQTAGDDGVHVMSATNDGFLVETAGSPTTTNRSFRRNGVEVQGAEGHGLYVGRADEDGVHVAEAGGHAGFFNNDGGSGLSTATVFAQNTSTAQGIAGWFNTVGTDATLVATQNGTGDIIKAFSGGNLRFRVHNNGNVTADGTLTGGGADLAEAFDVEDDPTAYAPGDVLVISTRTDRTVARSATAYSTHVVGVYATRPGVLLTERGTDETLQDRIPLGVVGVIPTKVSAENGPIRRGDLLVTAATPGHAMKADLRRLGFGMVLGKALEAFDGPGTGLIQVFVNVK